MKSVRHRHDDALSRVTWGAFEHLVAEHFRRQGYRVEHTGTGEGSNLTDGGIDLKLHRDQELIVVQCKHWNSFQVPHNDVHQLIGVMHTAGATGAIVISSGEFTTAAIEAAAKFRHIRLIDGKTVRAMLGPVAEPIVDAPALPEFPSWATLARVPARNTRRQRTDRAAAVAAVAAVVVMSGALVLLYTFYIREIQTAQMANLRTPSSQRATHVSQGNAFPAVMPGLVGSQRPMSTVNDRPAIVHEVPIAKEDLADWKRKNDESMRILEKSTPSLP